MLSDISWFCTEARKGFREGSRIDIFLREPLRLLAKDAGIGISPSRASYVLTIVLPLLGSKVAIISLTKSSINPFRQSFCSWLFIQLISGMEHQR